MRYREKILTAKDIESLLTPAERLELSAESARIETAIVELINYSDTVSLRSPTTEGSWVSAARLKTDKTVLKFFTHMLSDDECANGAFGIRFQNHGRPCMPFDFIQKDWDKTLAKKLERSLGFRIRSAYPDLFRFGLSGVDKTYADIGNAAVYWYLTYGLRRSTRMLHAIAAKYNFLPALELLDLYDSVGKSLPEHVPDLFPEARKIKRHFVIHVGGTNTGKTHDAMIELAKAESGVYLCPLRMLAYEGRENIRAQGTPCSFATGEEKEIDPDAKHVSETIGMLEFNKHYACAVIDEVQLISGQDGALYTNAILGVNADLVHVCCAWSGLEITKQLILLCGDDYEVIEHHRSSELLFEEQPYDGPRPHDAYIVFSRIAAYQTAEWLEEQGMHPAIVYGKLPYEVKMDAARRFESGEADTLVATDAIAIGQNYNIERIVFRDIVKHINRQEVRLDSQTVKQVAGRAGRYGRFPVGYVNTFHPEDREEIRQKLKEKDVPSRIAPLELPHFLIEKDLPLSLIFKAWSSFSAEEPFVKSDTSAPLMICRLIEDEFPEISKEDEYNLSSLPLDERDRNLIELLRTLLRIYVGKGNEDDYKAELPNEDFLTRLLKWRPHIADLETICRGLDLSSSFFYKMKLNDLASWAVRLKSPVTRKITEILAVNNALSKEAEAGAGSHTADANASGAPASDASASAGAAPETSPAAGEMPAAPVSGEKYTDKKTGSSRTGAEKKKKGLVCYIYVSSSGEVERNSGRFPTGDWSRLQTRNLPQSYGNEASYIDYYCYKDQKNRPEYTYFGEYMVYQVRLDPDFIVSDEGDYYLAEKFDVLSSEYKSRPKPRRRRHHR